MALASIGRLRARNTARGRRNSPVRTLSHAEDRPIDAIRSRLTPLTRHADPHHALAGRLLKEQDVTPHDHVLLQENVAVYLTHLVPARRAEALLKAPAAKVLPALEGVKWQNARWISKLRRDLNAPYTDDEVFQGLRQVQNKLVDYVSYARAATTKPFPMTIHITGSIAKGRAGAHSDLDAYADVGDPAAHRAAQGYEDPTHVLSMAPLPNDDPHYRSYLWHSHANMPTLTADAVTGDPMALQTLYAKRLERRGYRVDLDASGHLRGIEKIGTTPRKLEQPRLLDFMIGEAVKRKLQPPRRVAELKPAAGSSAVAATGPSAAGQTATTAPAVESSVGRTAPTVATSEPGASLSGPHSGRSAPTISAAAETAPLARSSRKARLIYQITSMVGAAAASGPLAPAARWALQTVRA